MKNRSFQMIIALVLMAYSGFSQRPTIELTFTAKYQSQHVMLDSILIQNLTQPGDTMLFAPDTVLFLDYVSGIHGFGGTAKTSFSVSPNYPNPSVDGKTAIDVFIPEREFVTMRVFNILGNEVALYENTLDAGNHHFTFLAGKERYYVLSVNCGNLIRSIKMINSGNSNQTTGTLSYQGTTEAKHPLKAQEAITGFDFSLGDQLQFTAYATDYHASIIIDIPESNKTYVFEMVPTAFICGNFITINHVTGEVAPVNKTVTYGTVTNIPGEPTKCWITSNLGADHQATAKDDATEASAGWYWQFNNKQGYKHDGTTRTPNTVWINYINENSDWIAENDPCAIELGNEWRIPTSTEWQNVDANGNWADWNGPWNSGLKLHAAGLLGNTDGLLYDRGTSGLYWSNAQYNPTDGWSLHFSNGFSSSFSFSKAGGFTLRCLKGESTSTTATVYTSGITDITLYTATGGGEVTNDGGAYVTARGVCWSTSQNPTIADSHTSDGSGAGVFISSLSGLIPNTQYFVKAYATNSVGTAYGNEEGFITLSSGFTCGFPIIKNHIAGTVAPVDKTVTYETVTNIPGEPLKCWITSNLGADNQATAVDDVTEAPAGWYWQFNNKQGYKHDGINRTPNTIWITNINENSDWIAANDPCIVELGGGWRIPSNTEWMNVNTAGNWISWNGPWNSNLKLHAAGLLSPNEGSLWDRGAKGHYWSSKQNDFDNGTFLLFFDGFSNVISLNKAYGFSIRCINEENPVTLPSVTTSVITDITQTNATGGGTVTDQGNTEVTARGVCWSTSPNPTIADEHTSDGAGIGNFISSLGGLTQNTIYYVSAYATNIVGTAYGSEMTFVTLSGAIFSCGDYITKEHNAGAVAPVDKTVIYGTVTGIPGESTKCWITSNLGADHQATSFFENTEASAGWYWQFNRKQGYKHDGITRTPDIQWLTAINENLDWHVSDDPCNIELGISWRMPTRSEWQNIDAAGNWTGWNGPWNSDLKLHAAGNLYFSTGEVEFRGYVGKYWSSSQSGSNISHGMRISSGECYVLYDNIKTNAFPIRCLNEGSLTTIPTVTTYSLSDIAQTTAASNSEVTNDGGTEVTARGICWSSSPNPTLFDNHTIDGSGTGAFVSNLTGLTPNTTYFARAYATNADGTALGNDMTFTTLSSGFSCGTSMTINHTAGAVAPVNKTVTYGIVTNIPGEPSKCWITSNLGADHQATSMDDDTEASAGWYWQFNRKQGFKHDGITRTPGSFWIYDIYEEFDWLAENDPCAIELGMSWHVPTLTEWLNVDAAGNWINWNGPWNSGLKLHAAGFLNSGNGNLDYRGTSGWYWGNKQYNNIGGYLMDISYYNSSTGAANKAYGSSIRCIMAEPASAIPAVVTSEITNITQTTATGGGDVINNSGSAIIARGVCWSTSQNPTTADNHTSDGIGNGAFVSNLTWLTPNTQYFIRAYAINSVGTAYGNEVNFLTLPGGFACGNVINYEGQDYNTVIIGNQCWFKENLNIGSIINGTQNQTNNSIVEKYCYNNLETNCDIFGGLYQWDEMMQYASTPGAAGICPSQWHIPTQVELSALITYLGGFSDAGGKMKEIGTIHWNQPNTGATNSSGFTAFGGGGRWTASFFDLKYQGTFWSSSQYDVSNAFTIVLYNSLPEAGPNNFGKVNGFSVRCVKDN